MMEDSRVDLRHPGARRRAILGVGAAAIVGLVVGAALLGLRGSGGTPSAAGTASASPAASAGTRIAARVPFGQAGSFAWAPDGAHLLVTDRGTYTTSVYDRSGKLVSQFGSLEGWLDAAHLIDGSGYVSDVGTSHAGGPTANSWVVASGHGAAAIIVAVPGCVGDPIIDWYRDGKYVKTGQKATPFGWSPDGKLALLGHLDCNGSDAELHGWKGPVDVVDFATGSVVTTVPGVRGEMAFSPDGTSLAAQSDADLEVVDLASGEITTVPGVRFLGWLDTESLYAASGSQIEFVDLDPLEVHASPGDLWQAASPAGLHLAGDITGAARSVLAEDGTTLLDLSSAGLVAERHPSSGDMVNSALQPKWWSPDGGMLALPSADGTSLVLISVDPRPPGSIG
jgi:WD40 repeat protein